MWLGKPVVDQVGVDRHVPPIVARLVDLDDVVTQPIRFRSAEGHVDWAAFIEPLSHVLDHGSEPATGAVVRGVVPHRQVGLVGTPPLADVEGRAHAHGVQLGLARPGPFGEGQRPASIGERTGPHETEVVPGVPLEQIAVRDSIRRFMRPAER